MTWEILGLIAWVCAGVFVVGAIAGGVIGVQGARKIAIGAFAVATLAGFIFSTIGGFSIGRFTMLLPILLTALVVSDGRGARLVVAAIVAGAVLYYLLAWLLPPLVPFWGIPIAVLICGAAYAVALMRPPPIAQPARRAQTG